EDFFIDREHFYLNNPPTLNVHPTGVNPAEASYLNALHDVHQMYGHFSDDEDNDYYPNRDAPDNLVPPSPETVNDSMLGHTVTQTSPESSSSLSAHTAPIVGTCAGNDPDAGSSTDLRLAGEDKAPLVGTVKTCRRVLKSKPYPKEVDVVVVSSSDDEV
ncbi:hypothetical protein MKW98_022573, partial [Papaver atlanticum]